MSKQIRNLGLFLMACYAALFLQVNRWTVFEADDLQNRPGNNRQAERDFDAPRGSISTADGVVLARSVEKPDAERFTLQREYPEGDLFGHITGFFNPLSVGTDGVEKQYNDELAGRDLTDLTNLDGIDRFFEDFFVEKDHVGNVSLTMRADVQRVARDALEGQRGTVVALDPRSGGILAMYSNPTYDPNLLAVHSGRDATAASEAMVADPNKPRLARAYQERYPPGSTFKVVTATAGVEYNGVTEDQPEYPFSDGYSATGSSRPIPNFGGDSCGGTLFEILRDSCNTAFAQMGVEAGGGNMVRTAEDYGFNQDVPLDLPRPATSNFPNTNAGDPAFLAQIAIGQNEVAATPLQMALVAAAVANGGEVMRPHVLAEIRDEDEEVVETYDPETWTTAMSPGTANLLAEAMRVVANEGTATRMREGIEGFDVGGKTGTAQIGDSGNSHAWIIGFAGPPGEEPQVVVAVIVEGQEGVSELTGGRVAAPIAAQVLAAALSPLPTPGEGSP